MSSTKNSGLRSAQSETLEEDQEAKPPDSVALGKRLLEYLEEKGKVLSPLLILTHDFPDPDAIAAAYGLAYLVQQEFDIEARIAYRGVIGRTENKAMVKILRIPAHKLRAVDLKRYPNIALVDTQPAFQNNPWPGNRKVKIVIDQHEPVRRPLAELTLVDPQCGASCVIVAQALLMSGLKIPARLATAIAYGILSDTMDLYRAKRRDVVDAYMNILRLSDVRALARIQNPPRSKSFFVTLARCIRSAARLRWLVVAHLGQVKNPELVAQMADFLLTYDNIKWTFCTGRYKGRLYASLRAAKQDMPAGEILRDVFEDRKLAGGHQSIAGGSAPVGLDAPEEVWRAKEAALQLRLVKRLRLPAKGEFWKPFKRCA